MLPWRLALSRVPAPMLAWARILHILLERGTIAGRRHSLRCWRATPNLPNQPQSTTSGSAQSAGRGAVAMRDSPCVSWRQAGEQIGQRGCDEKKEGVVGSCKRADWRASMAGHPSNPCAQPSCMATVSKDNIYTRQNVIHIHSVFCDVEAVHQILVLL